MNEALKDIINQSDGRPLTLIGASGEKLAIEAVEVTPGGVVVQFMNDDCRHHPAFVFNCGYCRARAARARQKQAGGTYPL